MEKYFVFSDVHSFYDEFISELKKKGFDENNPEHFLISCGDLFDRGHGSKPLLDFIYRMYRADRIILVKGNHDTLFEEMISRGYALSHDVSNGTVRTLMDLYVKQTPDEPNPVRTAANPEFYTRYDKRISELFKASKWYVESDKFIFVHGWIPLHCEDWRNATEDAWEAASWENGMQAWEDGIRVKGKTIVCGHWHCSWGWWHIKGEREEFPDKRIDGWQNSFEPFIADGIMAIDGCTAYSGKVNIIVLNEEDMYNN